MICVTGASGTLSSEVIRQLEAQDIPFRAAYFSGRSAEIARARGIEAVAIDYNLPATLRAAFRGCDTLFLLGPNALNQTELELAERCRCRERRRRAAHREAVGHGRCGGSLQPREHSPTCGEGHREERHGLDVSSPEQLHAERRHLHGADDQGGRVRSTARAVRRESATSTSATLPRWRWRWRR